MDDYLIKKQVQKRYLENMVGLRTVLDNLEGAYARLPNRADNWAQVNDVARVVNMLKEAAGVLQ